MFGAPGAGKGTYGGMLSTDLGFKNVSTGDAIRAFLEQEHIPEEMLHIEATIKSGKLIDD
jgi:adenylate kinase